MSRYWFLLAALGAPLSLAAQEPPPVRRDPPVPVPPVVVTPTPLPPRERVSVRVPRVNVPRVRVPRVPRVRVPDVPTPVAPRFDFEPRVRIAPTGVPRQQEWYQGDPADSLYRVAYSYFTRQEYRRAAERFSAVRSRYPSSRYFCDAAYYEAFARYRLGTPNDLRTGNTVLNGMSSRCPSSAQKDVPQLAARITGALARLGDADAAARLRLKASQGENVCDREERDVKIEALNALAHMDAQATSSVLRNVLNTKDECSAPVRRHAISLVARRNDAESVALLGQIARTDPARENQAEAVRALGRMSNDAAYNALEEFFRSSADQRLQREAASTMARSENARARTAVRGLIERNDVAESIRISLINALASNSTLTTDYWVSLYSKMESDELRQAVIAAIARSGGEVGQRFLIALARNPEEGSAARQAALSRVRSTAPIADLYRMFEIADSRSMRISIVSGLSARREPEATDRLIDIAKAGTDPEVRYAAIRALRQSPRNADPKVLKALGEIAAGCCRP